MAFAPNLHVFPGGRVDAADHDPRLLARAGVAASDAARRFGGNLSPDDAVAAHVAAVRELFEEAGVLLANGRPAALARVRRGLLDGTTSFADAVNALDIQLRADLLVPIAHWTTPPIMPRRFDTWFFAAELPAGAELTYDPREVVADRWLAPRAGLDAMRAGEIEMWTPTSVTLQQLEHVAEFSGLAEQVVFGPMAAPRFITERPDLLRIELSGAGAIPGQTVNAYVIGAGDRLIVDPGDPSDAAQDAIISAATRDDGRPVAIALTSADPEHAAGADALALRLDVPILAGPGAGRDLSFDVRELVDGDALPGDGGWTVRSIGAPRVDELAFVGPDGAAIVGDLFGGPTDRRIDRSTTDDATAQRVERPSRLGATLYTGHGEPVEASAWE